MPHKLTWESKGVVATYFGELVKNDFIKVNQEISGNRRSDQIKFRISDLSGAESLKLDTDDPSYIAAFGFGSSAYIKKQRHALVANGAATKSACEEYVRNSKKMGSPWVFKIFDNIEEAHEWASNL